MPRHAEEEERRKTLKLIVGGGVALLGLAGVTAMVRSCQTKRVAGQAASLVQRTYAALTAGNLADAVGFAARARALDDRSGEAIRAWIRATGLDLIEGPPDARRAVGFVSEVRALGIRQTDFAFTNIAAAVAMRNDRYAKRLLQQHAVHEIPADEFYDYAAGAALDLDAEPTSAAVRFGACSDVWEGAWLPRLRRARSLMLDDRLEDARRELDALEGRSAAADALGEILLRVTSSKAGPPAFDVSSVEALPRCLRPLAFATSLLSGADAAAGMSVALAEADSPLLAPLCARLAITSGDLRSAENAAISARQMRPESPLAGSLLMETRLLRGDLRGAAEAAEASGESELLLLVAAITAYEERRAEVLSKVAEDVADAGAKPWALMKEAQSALGSGSRPSKRELAKALAAHEPWADVLSVDAALEAGDWAAAEKITATWSDVSEARDKRLKRLAARQSATKP